MGEIILSPGDKQKIVSQPGRDEAYNIIVRDADVYLNHRPNGIVREGKRVSANDRAQAHNLRGKSLYAKNPSRNDTDAVVEVDQAGFALNFMTRNVVERPADAASRNNQFDVVTQLQGTTSGMDSILPFNNFTPDKDILIQEITLRDVDTVGTEATVALKIADPDGNYTTWGYFPYPDAFPVDFSPGLVYEEGSQALDLVIYQETGGVVEFDASVIYTERY